MSLRSLFRGLLWTLVGLAIVFYAAGGWFFSGELIEDAFVIDAMPIVVTSGDYDLEPVEYETELGLMEAWYLPQAGSPG